MNSQTIVDFQIEDGNECINEELTFEEALDALGNDMNFAQEIKEILIENGIDEEDINEQYIIDELLVNTCLPVAELIELLKERFPGDN